MFRQFFHILLLATVLVIAGTTPLSQYAQAQSEEAESEAIVRLTIKNYTSFNLYLDDVKLAPESVRWIRDEETYRPLKNFPIRKTHGSISFEAVAATPGYVGELYFRGDRNIAFALRFTSETKDAKLEVFGGKQHTSLINIKAVAEREAETIHHFTIVISEK